MNTKSLRTSIAAAMGGAVLVTGLLVGASFALAQDADEPEVTEETEANLDEDSENPSHFSGPTHMWGADIDDLLSDFGLTMDELKSQIADGATLEEIAAAAGIDLEGFLTRLRADVLGSIDDSVAAGDLSQQQGDAIKEKIESFDLEEGLQFRPSDGLGTLPKGMDFDGRGFGFQGRGFGGFGDMGGLLGDLDIDLDELREQLESGASLDEAFDALGIDLEALAAEAQADALAHLDEMVTDGVMTQEQADSIREMLESIDLSEGLPFGIGGFRFGGPLPDFDLDELDLDGFNFEDFDFGDFDFEGFRGPHGPGHGFGFFDGGDVPGDANADEALADA